MKKLLAGMIGTGLTAASLVGVSAETATAAPYPGTVTTNCHVSVLNSTTAGGTRVAVWVTAPGDGEPRGIVRAHVDRRKGGKSATRSGWFNGGKTVLKFGRLRPGVYDGRMFFNSMPERSVYKNCGEDFSFRVTRR